MKILFFIDNLGPGGKQRRLVELLKGLSVNSDFKLYLVLTKRELIYTDIYNLNVPIFYALRESKRDPKVFVTLYQIIKRIKPKVVHVWGNLEAIYALPSKMLCNVKLINGQITNAPSKVSNGILSHRITFPFSDIILSNSLAGINAYHAPKSKSKVIYNGFDFKRLQLDKDVSAIKNELNIKTPFVVGMVGSFAKRKDYSTFIKAINEILLLRDDITFLCVGDGDFLPYKELLNPAYQVYVKFLTHHDNVEQLMQICDIGVLTTYTEGISNAVLEFMALKKPVVVAGSGGCNEIVENGCNGYLLEPEDVLGVKEGIINLINTPELRLKFGTNSLQIVKEKFSIHNMIKEFVNVYKTITKQNA